MTAPRGVIGLTLLALVLYWVLALTTGLWWSPAESGELGAGPGHPFLQPAHYLASLLLVALGGICYLGQLLREKSRSADMATDRKYRALAEFSPDCLVVHEGDRILYANRATHEFFQIQSLPEQHRTSLSRLFEPACAEHIIHGPEFKLSPDGKPTKMETRLILHNGSSRDVALTTTPFQPEGDTALMTFVRDTSEQAAIRRDLYISRERLRLALNAAQDGVWDWDITSGKVVYSGTWAKMLGYTLDQLQPDLTTWGNLLHPADRLRAEDLIQAHLRGENPSYECEVRLRHKEGHYVWVLDRGQVVDRDPEERPVRMAGTHRDITARKEIELALKFRNRSAEIFLTGSEREPYPQILQLVCTSLESPAGMIGVQDRNGELQVMARIPKADAPAYPDGDPASCGAGPLPPGFQKAVSERTPVIMDETVNPQSDNFPWSCALAVPIMHGDLVLGSLLVANRTKGYGTSDLDFLVSLATHLAPTLQSHLASESKEAQLRKAQKMEALGALAGGIAHEFNNILQAVMGFAALARDEIPKGDIGRQDLDRVLGAAQRGKNLVERILLFSRREEHVHKPVAPAAIVNEAIELLRPTIPTIIRVEADVQQDTGLILADASQISQVVLNLATNAFHAMEETGGTMTIRLHTLAPDQSRMRVPKSLTNRDLVLLAVEDDGIGMDHATQDRLFDPFFTSKPVNKGTGLGLSVVHGIVTAHGGEISISSELGVGTTVNIFLPRIPSPSPLKNPLLPTAATQLVGKKILFVDDDRNIAQLGHDLLAKLGCEVKVETESPRALTWLQRNHQNVDLVVTDLSMPNLSGLQIAAQVHRIRPDLPVILTTGTDDPLADLDDTQPAIKGVLRKPFNIEELHHTICQALSRIELGADPTV